MSRRLFFEAPNLVKLRRDFGDEARGTLQHRLAAGIVRDHQGVCDVELVAGARQRHVPEAALLFFAVGVAQRSGRGELAVGGPDDEDGADL